MGKLRIKDAAIDHGMTLADVAEKLGIRSSSLSQAIRRNNFSIDRLNTIADVIGCKVIDLFRPEFTAMVRKDGDVYAFDTFDDLYAWVVRQKNMHRS